MKDLLCIFNVYVFFTGEGMVQYTGNGTTLSSEASENNPEPDTIGFTTSKLPVL